jgi:hypothetical protein
MAVWFLTYGANGLLNESKDNPLFCLNILNEIKLDEIKILNSEIEAKNSKPYSLEEHYNKYRTRIEDYHKSMGEEKYKEYLASIHFEYIKIEDIVDKFIFDDKNRIESNMKKFNSIYQEFSSKKIKSKWIQKGRNHFCNNLNYFEENDGIRIFLSNDLISISGPFSIFSNYGTFQDSLSKISKEYYHDYFKRLLKAFKSDFILHTHEWAGINHEEDDFCLKDLSEFIERKMDDNSRSIQLMDSIYFERI